MGEGVLYKLLLVNQKGLLNSFFYIELRVLKGGCRGRDHMIVGFTTTRAISAYHHYGCEFESHSWRGILDTCSIM